MQLDNNYNNYNRDLQVVLCTFVILSVLSRFLSTMWIEKSIFVCMLFIFNNGIILVQSIPQDDEQVLYGVTFDSFPPHIIIGDDRIDFSQLFSPDDWFPIEINVPDTVMGAWHGIQSAWNAASDYFSSNGEMPQKTIKLTQVYIFN